MADNLISSDEMKAIVEYFITTLKMHKEGVIYKMSYKMMADMDPAKVKYFLDAVSQQSMELKILSESFLNNDVFLSVQPLEISKEENISLINRLSNILQESKEEEEHSNSLALLATDEIISISKIIDYLDSEKSLPMDGRDQALVFSEFLAQALSSCSQSRINYIPDMHQAYRECQQHWQPQEPLPEAVIIHDEI